MRGGDVAFGGDGAGLEVTGGAVRAEGDLDFRGTMGVDRDTPVGFRSIRLEFEVESDIDEDALADLLETTERYCVVLQTIRGGVGVDASISRR